MSLGLGGATVADLLFFRFLTDFRISRKEHEVLRLLASAVAIGLLAIIVTGFLLYLPNMERLNESPAFQFKIVIVLILACNGLLLHEIVAPRLIRLSFSGKKSKARTLRHVAFALGAVSFVSWYTVFFISVLKSLLPLETGFLELMAFYGLLLTAGIAGGQAAMTLLVRRAEKA